MKLIAKEYEDDWDFQVIPEDFAGRFVDCVVSDYEYSIEDAVLEIPFKSPYNLRVLIEGFEDSYMLYESMIEEDMFPDMDWEKLTESERGDICEQVSNEAYAYDHLFLADVRKVLDKHQLFYLICEYASQIKGDLTFINSPLQEVW